MELSIDGRHESALLKLKEQLETKTAVAALRIVIYEAAERRGLWAQSDAPTPDVAHNPTQSIAQQ